MTSQIGQMLIWVLVQMTIVLTLFYTPHVIISIAPYATCDYEVCTLVVNK